MEDEAFFLMQYQKVLLCVYKWQAEKKLKVQLTTLEQQHSKTQEALKEKENQLEKLRAQLKAAQGSFEEEMKKLKGQTAELQEFNAKKASSILNTNTDMHTVINCHPT